LKGGRKLQNKKEIYLISEVSDYLRLHPYTVRRLARTGKIPAFKAGGQWRFDGKEIERWKSWKH